MKWILVIYAATAWTSADNASWSTGTGTSIVSSSGGITTCMPYSVNNAWTTIEPSYREIAMSSRETCEDVSLLNPGSKCVGQPVVEPRPND